LRKTLAVLLLLMLAITSVLAGCTSNNATDGGTVDSGGSDKGGSEPSGPVTIKTFAPQGTNYNLNTNWFTQHVEEKFNINFEFQTTTWDGAAAKEQRKIALAGGDYPELFLLIPWVDKFSASEMIQYGKQEVLLPLNDLIKEHAPNLQKVLDSHQEFKAMATAPDGNIYAMPQLIECFHCSYGAKFWIQNTWLKDLNLEMPKTTEEFREVLKAFKTKDPNGNKKADEIPLTGATNISIVPYLMNAFIYDDSQSRIIVENGKLKYAPIQTEWKDGVAYLRSLYDEGLIDPGAFTQNQDAYKQLGENADAMLIGVGSTSHPGVFVSNQDYQKHYNAMQPLTGPNGKRFATRGTAMSVGGVFALTNKASKEQQIAAIKLLDYMFTQEGQLNGYLGKEGVGWRGPQPGDVALNEKAEPLFFRIPKKNKDEKHHNTDWAPLAQYYQPREFRDRWISSTDIYSREGYERRLQQATYLYEGLEPKEIFPYWAMWYDPAVVDEFAMLETNIKNYVEQNLLQFITGSKDLNKEWDAYVQGLEKLI
jgi:putative aldouronate transport system substrate-binding protein